MPNLVNDFEVRKETLRALGGDPTGLANIFEVDKEILRLTQQGGGGEGIPDAPSDGKTYGRNNGTWTPVESGYPIKQGVQIDNNIVSVENYGIYTKLNGNFISYESGDNYVRLYDKLEVVKDGEKSEANFIDVANAGNGVVKTSNNGKVKFWSGTQAEYDAIATKDSNTIYIIK